MSWTRTSGWCADLRRRKRLRRLTPGRRSEKDSLKVREFVLVDPQADLEIDTTSALGSGGFGRVMKALLKRGGGSTGAYEHEVVAVKMLFASNKLSEELLKTFYVEAYQMSQLVHPNIVHLHGACIRPPHLCLVQELAELSRRARRAPRARASPACRSAFAAHNSPRLTPCAAWTSCCAACPTPRSPGRRAGAWPRTRRARSPSCTARN